MRIVSLVIVVFALAVTRVAAITITGLSGSTINPGAFSGVGELSGITYVGPAGSAGTHRFYVVSDNASGEGATPRVYGINVTLNMDTGSIISASVTSQINLSVGYDLEGIAFKSGRLFVSDENSTSSKIREYDISTGLAIRDLVVPSVFANGRDNFGFESLTFGPNLWTANEEALTVDGALSTTSTGSIVRLLKYDYGLNPSGQWAYQTDPKGSNFLQPSAPRCGVCDLISLPDGTLLVLERWLGLNFRSRIYQVDFTGATDVSGIPGLAGASYTKTSKTLLWGNSWPLGDTSCNYEGICLGPQLNDGSWSLLMLADNAVGSAQPIYALRASDVAPAPAPTVESVTPGSAPNTAPVSITNLAGSGFVPGATVAVSREGSPDINASNVAVTSPNALSCVIDVSGATPGLWDVTVRNPDGQSGTLSKGFAVTIPDTTAAVGITNSAVLYSTLQTYAVTNPVTVWGKVLAADSSSFVLDDGSLSPITVRASGYEDILPGDYACASGTLDPLAQPVVLISSPNQVRKLN